MNYQNESANPSNSPTRLTAEPLDLTQYRVCVVIPAFNEARYIGSVVLRLKRRPLDILVVDDGSQDDTAEIARAAGADVLQLEINQGKGAALNAGLVISNRDMPP